MMINWRKGQYILHKNYVAKINKVEGNKIKLRKFSKGNTVRGYHYQQWTNKKRLTKLWEEGQVTIIYAYDVLKILFWSNNGKK